MANRLFALAVIVLSSIFFWGTNQFATTSGGYNVSPAFFPRLILMVMLVLAIIIFIKSFFNGTEPSFFQSVLHYCRLHWRVGVMIFFIFLFIYLMPIVGFLYASIVFLICSMLLLLQAFSRNIIVSCLVIAIIAPLAIDLLFRHVLGIYLP
ncbi:tripartite tricarboxylate transporter TctB family protein [Gracilibacillus sp. HCP3S3_G5_1]|uniref:tripartite tricarboxylate transporter TctB family protein n=1 Tax=unclassified Gracilibacillus TaxID=2625209 RepID=UPI003F88950E